MRPDPDPPAYNTRIREMASSDRPRERLRDIGAENLSNAELLAILLRTGSRGQSVLSLATQLLARHDGLRGLSRLSYSDLKRLRGIGEAKAAELRAAFALATRLRELDPAERAGISSPRDVYNLLGSEMSLLDQEHLRVVLLNTRNHVMGVHEVYKGSVSTALVRMAEVFREAVRANAPSLVIVHNHPSGDPSPSADDVTLTRTAVSAGSHLQIDVLDHVIIGDKKYVSLKELGAGFE